MNESKRRYGQVGGDSRETCRRCRLLLPPYVHADECARCAVQALREAEAEGDRELLRRLFGGRIR